MQSCPDIETIIVPASVGIAAAAQAIADAENAVEINVVGLGLPTEMAGNVENCASHIDPTKSIWRSLHIDNRGVVR